MEFTEQICLYIEVQSTFEKTKNNLVSLTKLSISVSVKNVDHGTL